MPGYLAASLGAFSASFVLAVAPAPRRPLRWSGALCAGLVLAAASMFVIGAALPFAGLWVEAAIVVAWAVTTVLPSMWLARAPDEPDDDGEDDGGGPPVDPPDPEPCGPARDSGPEGPGIDWGEFDDLRAGWRAREPAPLA